MGCSYVGTLCVLQCVDGVDCTGPVTACYRCLPSVLMCCDVHAPVSDPNAPLAPVAIVSVTLEGCDQISLLDGDHEFGLSNGHKSLAPVLADDFDGLC